MKLGFSQSRCSFHTHNKRSSRRCHHVHARGNKNNLLPWKALASLTASPCSIHCTGQALPSRFRGCETSPGSNPAAGAGRDTDRARAAGGAALPGLAMLEERCRLPWPCWGNLGRLCVKASAGPAVPGGQRCRGGATAVWRVKVQK